MQDGGMAPDYSILDRATMEMQQAAQMSAQNYGAIPLQQAYNQTMMDMSYAMAPPIPSTSAYGGGGYSAAYLESIRLQRELSAQQMGSAYQAQAERAATVRANVGLVGGIAGMVGSSLISNPLLSAAASVAIPLGVSTIAESMGLYDAPPEVNIGDFTRGNIAQSAHLLAWNQLDPFVTGGLRGVSINAAKDMAETLYGAARQVGFQGMEVSRIMPALESVGGYSGVTNPDEIVNRTVQYIDSIANFIKKTRASLDDAVAVIGSGLAMGAGTAGVENFMANISTYSAASGMSMGNYINTIAQIASPLQGMAGDYSGIAGGFGQLLANTRVAQMYDPNAMSDIYWAQAGGPAQVAATMANIGMSQFTGTTGMRRAAALSVADPGAYAQYMATGVMPSEVMSDYNAMSATERYQAIFNAPGWISENSATLGTGRMTQMFNNMPSNLRFSNNEEAQAGYLYSQYGIPTAMGYGLVQSYNSYRQGYGLVAEEAAIAGIRNDQINNNINQVELMMGRLGQARALGNPVGALGLTSGIISSEEITSAAGINENRFRGRNVESDPIEMLSSGADIRYTDLAQTAMTREQAELTVQTLNNAERNVGNEGFLPESQRRNMGIRSDTISNNFRDIEYEVTGEGFTTRTDSSGNYYVASNRRVNILNAQRRGEVSYITIDGQNYSEAEAENILTNRLQVTVESEDIALVQQGLLENGPDQVMSRLFNTNPIADLYVMRQSRIDPGFRQDVVGLIDNVAAFVDANGMYRSEAMIPSGAGLDEVARSTQVAGDMSGINIDGIMQAVSNGRMSNTNDLMNELANQRYGVNDVTSLTVEKQQEIANMVGYGQAHGYWDTAAEGWTDITYGDLTGQAEATLDRIYSEQASQLGLRNGGTSMRRIMDALTPEERDQLIEYTFNGGDIPESLGTLYAAATAEGYNMNTAEGRERLLSATARGSTAIGISNLYGAIGGQGRTGLSQEEFANRLLEGNLRVSPWTGEGGESAASRLFREYQRGGLTAEETTDLIARSASGKAEAWEEPAVQQDEPVSVVQHLQDISGDVKTIVENGLKLDASSIEALGTILHPNPGISGGLQNLFGLL